MDSNANTPLDGDRLQQALAREDLRFTVLDADMVRVDFSPSAGRPAVAFYVASEDGGSVFTMSARLQTAYALDAALATQQAVLQWQDKHRWPTGAVDSDDGDVAVRGFVHLPVTDGVTDATLQQWLRLGFSCINQMLLTVHAAALAAQCSADVPDAAELEDWL